LDSLVKADRNLTTRGLALVRGFFHNKSRSGNRPPNLSDSIEEARAEYVRKMPRIDSIVRPLGGNWDVVGAAELRDKLSTEFETEFLAQGAHAAEARFRSQRKVNQILRERVENPKKAYVTMYSTSENAEINLYMDGSVTDGTLNPIATPDDIAQIRDGINSARNFRFNKDKLTVNVLSNSSDATPNAVKSELGDTELAFTFLGGNGIYIFPEKVDKLIADSDREADFFSTDTSSKEAAYKHLIVHESGHLQMYKLWGEEGKSSGRKELAKDFDNFNVSQKGTSGYGDESVSESFAEQYAKYLLTGDASDEFMELLASKGLTRAQLNKKWRDNYPQLKDSFFKFVDGIFADDQGQNIPEFNGPEASEYDKTGKYGAARVHKIARIFGFTQSKPETVDSITNDKYVIYRGVDSAKGMSAWELHNQFRTADMPWYGYGIYGDGQYASTESSTASNFGSVVAKMRVKPDAKIYNHQDGKVFDSLDNNQGIDIPALQRSLYETGGILEQIVLNEVDPDLEGAELQAEVRKLEVKMGLNGRASDHDLSILAGMLGFQGIELRNNNFESYFVILDRSALEMLVPPGLED
jgi:hypothetical protein